MANPYDNLRFSQSQYIPQYHGAPIEEFKNLLQKRETDYETNIGALDQLELAASDLDVNDADYIVKKEALNKVKNQIQAIADSGGAYEFAGRQVRQVAKEFTGNQALKAAVSNQALIKAKKEEYQKLYLDDDMSKVGRDRAFQLLGEYEGVGKGEEGIYDTPELYNPIKYTNVGEKLDAFGRGFKADKISSGWVQTPDGRWFDKVTNTHLKASDVEEAMREYAQNSPDMMATLNEHQTITGEDMLSGLIKAEGIKLGFKEEEFDRITNQYTLNAEKAAMANKTIGSGVTFDVLQRINGANIKSKDQYDETVSGISKRYDEALAIRNKLSIDPYTNKAQIADLNQEMDALKGQREALEAKDSLYIDRALKELNITDIPKEAREYLSNQFSGKKAFIDDYINQRIGGSGNIVSPFVQDQAEAAYVEYAQTLDPEVIRQGQIYAEQYPEYVQEIAAISDKVNQYYQEAGEDKIGFGTLTVPVTEKERKTLAAVVDAGLGLGELSKGKSLKDIGVDVMAVGISWVGTEKGGQPISDSDAEEIHGRGEVGYLFNSRTGRKELAFDVLDVDGRAIGKVSMSTPSLTESLNQLYPDRLGIIVGPQVTAITNSFEGKGTVELGGVHMQVEYLGNDKEAAQKGNYRITYEASDGTVTKQIPNNLAVMNAIQNLYYQTAKTQ